MSLRRGHARLAVLASALLATTGCELPRFSMPSPATSEGERVLSLWQGSIIAAAIVGGITYALIVWSLVRYRRRNDDLPTQTEYHIPLEIAYTLFPLLIVIGLFGFTYSTQRAVLKRADDPLVVDVTGFKWGWRFAYAGTAVESTPDTNEGLPEVVVPVGRPVRFRLHSPDVIHSFFVPKFLFKHDVIPGRVGEWDTTVAAPGSYYGFCAEFCGLEHAQMTFSVRALPPAEFDEWFAGEVARAGGSQ